MANSHLTPADLARMSIAEQYEWFKAATSRRSLLRGGLVGAGTIAAGATVLAGPAADSTGSSASSAAPQRPHPHRHRRCWLPRTGLRATYVVAGSAGNSLYAFTASGSYEGAVDDDTSITSWYCNSSGGKTTEPVDWSRVRYTGYALLAVDSEPGSGYGAKPKLVLRALDEDNVEVDRLTIQRAA
ncbi:hypothetical protein [Actinospica sp.]|uniref:hypothetical protein n=1 Tax=Actinospica sp. TaxID=1872142 RepID=UPI002CF79580|nr:hypothetical protein [Actinospica sp.]HWG24446.1 hypothetical protein [Actinospica sp.]